MDSLTQIVLGASVGELCLGKKMGNKAALWGAVIGTLPDLDVLANFFQNELQSMMSHRGFSHSIVFCILMAPILGALLHRLYRKREVSFKSWSFYSFWILITHPLLDSFTTWGTQLFYPFSSYKVAFNTINVVDPLYTLPFLICLLVAMFLPRTSIKRRRWNKAGLWISCFYLVLTIANKSTVDNVISHALHIQGKGAVNFSTYPTLANNVLWYAVAVRPHDYLIGYYSLLDEDQKIRFRMIPKNHDLLELPREAYMAESLNWISKGQFSLTEKEGSIFAHDLRFGLTSIYPEDSTGFIFNLKLIKEGDSYQDVTQPEWGQEDFEPVLKKMRQRIFNKKEKQGKKR